MPFEKATLKECATRLCALALFRDVLQNTVVRRLLSLLEGDAPGPNGRVTLYADFVSALYKQGGNLGDLLLRLVLESENVAVKAQAADKELPAVMQRALHEELATFTLLSSLGPEEVAAGTVGTVRSGGAPLPSFLNTRHDFAAVYTRRLAEIKSRGFGIFASHHMFTLGDGGAVLPVQNPDPQRLSELFGYQRERESVIINTRALLRALPAANILLYGDAGTGKSSTVKAIANEYHTRGLRLIEVRKDQIYHIPALMDTLAENPLKFILFIDDLSFPTDDADFTALKAILEGNVAARPRNIVVYATSNRRHMVREMAAARQSEEVAVADTLEEEASLAARFGLTVTFLKPDRALFADILHRLWEEYDLRTPFEDVLRQAEVQVLRQGGRSPRAARQFIEFVRAGEEDGPSFENSSCK